VSPDDSMIIREGIEGAASGSAGVF